MQIYCDLNMTTSIRTIILLQFIVTSSDYDFRSPALVLLEKVKKSDDTLFTLDNLSESVTLHYAKSLIDGPEEIILVCDLSAGGSLGPFQGLLNHCLRKKNVRLISIGESEPLKPFIHHMKGKVVSYVDDLKPLIA